MDGEKKGMVICELKIEDKWAYPKRQPENHTKPEITGEKEHTFASKKHGLGHFFLHCMTHDIEDMLSSFISIKEGERPWPILPYIHSISAFSILTHDLVLSPPML